MNYYAGIGSRETPKHILNIMSHVGSYLGSEGWTLRSGAAEGADIAFEEGANKVNSPMEIYLPWAGYNFSKSELNPKELPFSEEEKQYTAVHHPAWKKCSPSARLLHQRNTRIIIGHQAVHGDIVQAVKFIVCWTDQGQIKGGTGQALRIAERLRIPVVNLGNAHNARELEALVLQIDALQEKLKNREVLG